MAENKLIIDTNTLVKEAFYAIPDFTDESGRHLGGVYGALFKIINDLKTGGFDSIEIKSSDQDAAEVPSVQEQTEVFTKIWMEVAGHLQINANEE